MAVHHHQTFDPSGKLLDDVVVNEPDPAPPVDPAAAAAADVALRGALNAAATVAQIKAAFGAWLDARDAGRRQPGRP